MYFDNFFSSVDLFLDLLRVGLYGCGTLRSNRKGFPKELKPLLKKGLGERGEYKVRQHKQLTVSLWQDNRPVVTISTNSDPTQQTTVQRKARDGTSSTFCCPESISLYNKFMGGVDRNDQLRQYYAIRMKGRKYYKYIWWFLFDVAVTNAYILCKNHTNLTVPSVKDFRIDLAKALIGEYCSRKRIGRPSAIPPAQRFCEAHFPRRGAEKPHRCYYCHHHRGKKRHETVWYCNSCQLFLCHNGKDQEDCFLAYHRSLHRNTST